MKEEGTTRKQEMEERKDYERKRNNERRRNDAIRDIQRVSKLRREDTTRAKKAAVRINLVAALKETDPDVLGKSGDVNIFISVISIF